MKSAFLNVLVGGCLLMLCGCAKHVADSSEPIYDGPVNSCDSDSDCPAPAVCDPDLDICVVGAPFDDGNWLVRITPDSSNDTPAQVMSFGFDSAGNVTGKLAVNTPITVNAATGAWDDGLVLGMTASVVLLDIGNNLPGRHTSVFAFESENSKAFETELLPSTYRIMVVPRDPQDVEYPVQYFEGMTIDAGGRLYDSSGEETSLIIYLGEATVKGTVLQGGHFANGLTVEAVDPVTERTISTVDTTACVAETTGEICGRFALRLPADTGAYSLKISRPVEPHHPVHVLSGFTLPSQTGDQPVVQDLAGDPRLSLSALGVPIRYHVKVERPVLNADGQSREYPAPGCYVVFESQDVAGGRVELGVTTNEAGEIEDSPGYKGVSLYEGLYNVTIVPPVAGDDAVDDYSWYFPQEPITVADNLEPVPSLYILERRPLVSGSVTVGGKVVPGSAVIAEPLSDAPNWIRSNSASSDKDGRYTIWLDESEYYVVSEAPAESDYAWNVQLFEVEGNSTLDLELAIPFVVTGSLMASEDQVNPIDLGGAIIEWFRLYEGKTYPVGRTVAESDGAFTALLPPL